MTQRSLLFLRLMNLFFLPDFGIIDASDVTYKAFVLLSVKRLLLGLVSVMVVLFYILYLLFLFLFLFVITQHSRTEPPQYGMVQLNTLISRYYT